MPELATSSGCALPAIDNASFERLSKLLRDETGIKLNESKRSLMVSRLGRRLRDLSLPGFAEYCHHLDGPDGAEEFRHMVSLLTTNVTRFFREPHHFRELQDSVLPPLAEVARRGGRVRIWSAGCSSGQEPCSIAMTFLQVMPNACEHDVRILATDIDSVMIAKGKSGIYEYPADNGLSTEQIGSWFCPIPEKPNKYKVRENVHSLITFAELNLMHDWPMSGPFDIIFCRNTVIYFDPATQAKLWPRFARLLRGGGHLFVGHSERVTGPAEELLQSDGVTKYVRR